MLKQVFDFFVFTSLFIALCAVLMVYQTALLFDTKFPVALYAFVFSGSVCSYNFHWLLTPPDVAAPTYKLKWNITNRPLHILLFLLGVAGAVISCLLLIQYWLWLGVTALFTFLYSAPKIAHPFFMWLRQIAIGKTIYLAFAWAHVTALLPLLVAEAHLHPSHIWFVVNRFLFIYTICIVFDRRDVEGDRAAGIKSLVTLLHPRGIDRLFWFATFLVLLSSVILLQWLSWPDVAILLLPTFIMSLLYEATKTNHSDYLYYFLLDGLMALSAPILILAKFVR